MKNDTAAVHFPMATLPEEQRRLMERIGPVWGTDIGKHRDLVLYGIVLIVALRFLPNGIAGLFARRSRRKEEPAHA